MATNSTPLASQFVVGVALPRRCQQLRTNLITTKPHGTKIAASRANPALKYDAVAFGSKPSQLQPNLVPETKRDKFVTYAFPGTITVDIPTSGVPEYTQIECTIEPGLITEKPGVVWMNFWVGSDHVSLTPDGSELKDEAGVVKKFERGFEGTHKYYHSADTTDPVKGSVGCVSYDIGKNLQWVVAWRNSTNERNKVYTTIVSDDTYANVSDIRTRLYHSTDKSTFEEKAVSYIAEANIDKNSPKPKLTATLKNTN